MRRTCLAVAQIALMVSACDQHQDPQPMVQQPAASTQPLPSASAASAPSAAASSLPAAAAAQAPPKASVACKAAPGKQVALGTRQDSAFYLGAWGDRVYALSYSQPRARVTLSYFVRDGSAKGDIGNHVGLGEPRSFRLADDQAFFTRKSALIGIPLAGGEAVVLSKDFGSVVNVANSNVYGVHCSKDKRDTLVAIPMNGGETKQVAVIERKSAQCHYGDLAIDGGTAFITDWDGRRLLGVSLASGQVQVLGEGFAFADSVFPYEKYVDLTDSKGIVRVPRAGGASERRAGIGASPFATVVSYGDEYWVFDAQPYGAQEYIKRLGHESTKPEGVYTFFVQDVTSGSGVSGLAADDACFYYARAQGDFTTYYAQGKP